GRRRPPPPGRARRGAAASVPRVGRGRRRLAQPRRVARGRRPRCRGRLGPVPARPRAGRGSLAGGRAGRELRARRGSGAGMNGLAPVDYGVMAAYAIVLVAIATWVSRPRGGHERDTADYFLAGKALPWWAIGASLIAANISAEQVIGMSGSGYAIGLAIASYEWM